VIAEPTEDPAAALVQDGDVEETDA